VPSHDAGGISLAAEPDRFAFPSGHAAAAMSVAIAYAVAYPSLAAPRHALMGYTLQPVRLAIS
jgi:membrane-associated phospholipid phosphatase